MLEELANIYEQALENPNQYLHMNRKMVEWMKAKAQYLPPEKILFHRYLQNFFPFHKLEMMQWLLQLQAKPQR